MTLRTALLAGILALAARALPAQEIQMTFSGQAVCMDTPACSVSVPYQISMDIDTLSGHQFPPTVQLVNGVPSVVSFDAENMHITDFTEIVGGNRAFVASADDLNINFTNPLGGSDFAMDTQNFLWDSGALPPPPAAGFSLENYLLSWNGLSPGSDGAIVEGLAADQTLQIASAHIVAVKVAEPGLLTLLITGLAGLALGRLRTDHFVRRHSTVTQCVPLSVTQINSGPPPMSIEPAWW